MPQYSLNYKVSPAGLFLCGNVLIISGCEIDRGCAGGNIGSPIATATAYECQRLCASEEECKFFTRSHLGDCYLQTREGSCRAIENWTHGTKFCRFERCRVSWNCEDEPQILVYISSAPTASSEECQKLCVSNEECKFFTRNNDRECYLQEEREFCDKNTSSKGSKHCSFDNDGYCINSGIYGSKQCVPDVEPFQVALNTQGSITRDCPCGSCSGECCRPC